MNVRLGPDDARKAEELRGAGIRFSTVVREAIRSEYERRIGGRKDRRSPSEIGAEIGARHPVTGRSHGRDTTDRDAVQRYVLGRLRKNR